MAKVIDNMRIYGGDSDAVWCAPKGTAGLTDLTAPPSPWDEVGWLAEDGVDRSIDGAETLKFTAHQGGRTVRTKRKDGTYQFTFVCMETTALTLGLIHGPITWTKSGTGASAIARGVPSGTTPEMAWIIDLYDVQDGVSVHDREVYSAGTAELTGSMKAKYDEIQLLEFTVTASGKPDIITNAANIIAAV